MIRQSKAKDLLFFIIGFAISNFITFTFFNNKAVKLSAEKHRVIRNFNAQSKRFMNGTNIELYEHEMADNLFTEVRVLCWVFTHPENHRKKVPHVRNTWGKRFNKLLFMSTRTDPQYPDIIALPVEDGRQHLWNKTRLAMKYVYDHHLNDADWFMRADDDNYIVLENLRHKLSQYSPDLSLYFGHRFVKNDSRVPDGYMAGGGHIFSKKALVKFVVKIMANSTLCFQNGSVVDDLFVGHCLAKHAIFIDARDVKNEKQIFPVGVKPHMKHSWEIDEDLWYWRYLWRNVTQGGLKCCSDLFIGAHYIRPKEMHLLEYLVYNVHPFGVQKNLTEQLPRKFNLHEIIEASDAKSFASNYIKHENIHYFDFDEIKDEIKNFKFT